MIDKNHTEKAIVERDEEIARLREQLAAERQRAENTDQALAACHDALDAWIQRAEKAEGRIEGLEEALRISNKGSQEREHALELMDKLVRGEDAEWYSWQRVYQTMEEIIDQLSSERDVRDAYRHERDSAIDNLQATAQGYVRMEEALHLTEWVEYNDPDYGFTTFCPVCRNEKKHGHHKDCKVRKALEANQ